jgi:hypothetical protein
VGCLEWEVQGGGGGNPYPLFSPPGKWVNGWCIERGVRGMGPINRVLECGT